jgi:hypothetical protein
LLTSVHCTWPKLFVKCPLCADCVEEVGMGMERKPAAGWLQ